MLHPRPAPGAGQAERFALHRWHGRQYCVPSPSFRCRSRTMAKSDAAVSPFAPKALPEVPVIDGVRFAACEAGIKYRNRKDLMIAVMDEGTVAAGVLTQSKTCSAPVLWCRESLKSGKARA